MVDSKFALLLSDFFLDIAKAFFIATFITPSLNSGSNIYDIVLVLFKGLINVIIFLVMSRQFLEFTEKNESN